MFLAGGDFSQKALCHCAVFRPDPFTIAGVRSQRDFTGHLKAIGCDCIRRGGGMR